MFLCQSIRPIHKLPIMPIFSGLTALFKIDLPNFSKSFGDVFTIRKLRTAMANGTQVTADTHG